MPKVIISEPGKKPQPYRFEIERNAIRIGRADDNDITIECSSVSTHHSLIERVQGGYVLRDSNSTNGIKQDNTLMEVIDLYDTMQVSIGDVPLQFQLSEEEINELSKEEFIAHQKKKLPRSNRQEELPLGPPEQVAPVSQEAQASPSGPRSFPPPAAPSPPRRVSPLLIILLMLAAVIGGMTIRHYKDHGVLLFSKFTEKNTATPSEEKISSEDVDQKEPTP